MKFRALLSLEVGRSFRGWWLYTGLLAVAALTACAQGRPKSVDVGQPRPSASVAVSEPAGVEVAKSAVATGLEVRYLANEGFLVEGAGLRVLVDGLFGTGISGYPVVPPDMRGRLENGVSEWGDIQVVFATHFHGDHFDPDSVAQFLEANPQAVFVSTPQAVDRLTEGLTEQTDILARLRAVLPAEGAVERLEIDGVEIEVLNLHHGRRDPPVQNLGFVITLGDRRFLHFGDTEAKMEEFEPYLDLLREPDLALLPFWFLSSEWRAGMVRDLIRPRSIVVAHLPTPDAEASYFGRWRNYDDLVQSITVAFPDARLPQRPGEQYRFPGD